MLRRLGALLAVAALAVAGCADTADDAPADTAQTPRAAPGTPTSTPTPEPSPTPTPTRAVLSASSCTQLNAAVQGAKALNPDPEVVLPALDGAREGVPEELIPNVDMVAESVRAHLDDVAAMEGLVDPLELEVPSELVAACAGADIDLADVPYPVATVPEICVELHRISQYQDLQGLELIIDVSLRRARTYTPAEIEPGVRAFSDRVETVWDGERPPESADDEAARLALGDRCEQEGWILLQPA
ncbi:hypothetical protein [Georgenia sp. Marseille-Q6866]